MQSKQFEWSRALAGTADRPPCVWPLVFEFAFFCGALFELALSGQLPKLAEVDVERLDSIKTDIVADISTGRAGIDGTKVERKTACVDRF